MTNALNVIGAVTDVFTWLGVAAVILFGIMLIVIALQQGSWHKVHAMLEREGESTVARWFDDAAGGVGAAILTTAQAQEVGDATSADLWVRSGQSSSVRLQASSPAKRPTTVAFFGSLALVLVSAAVSLGMLIAEG